MKARPMSQCANRCCCNPPIDTRNRFDGTPFDDPSDVWESGILVSSVIIRHVSSAMSKFLGPAEASESNSSNVGTQQPSDPGRPMSGVRSGDGLLIGGAPGVGTGVPMRWKLYE